MKQISLIFLMFFTVLSCGSNKEAVESDQNNRQTQSRQDKNPNDRKGPPSIEEVFKMDVNEDGLLSKAEVKGKLAERFSIIDADGDGFITKSEFENAPKPERRRGGKRKN